VRTPLCDVVGIEVPIVLAPMGGAVTPELAAAVSNAGGLGLLPLSWASPEEIASVVEQTRELTGRPFGGNFGLEWDQRERLAAALEAGVRVVSFFWGDASGLIDETHDAGALVSVTVGTAEEGRAAAVAGADVVVAQGWEAGGHVWGTVSTLALVPRVVDTVAPLPVVAAGGVADGRGLAAVLALRSRGYDAEAPDLPFDDPTASYEERALPAITALKRRWLSSVTRSDPPRQRLWPTVIRPCSSICVRDSGPLERPRTPRRSFGTDSPFPLLRPLTAFFPSCSRRSPRSLTARMRLDLGVEAFQSGDEDVLSEEGGDLDCRLDTVVVARAAEDVDGAKNPGLAHDRRPVSSTATAGPDSPGPGEGSPVTF
jgi:hypothetical protein